MKTNLKNSILALFTISIFLIGCGKDETAKPVATPTPTPVVKVDTTKTDTSHYVWENTSKTVPL